MAQRTSAGGRLTLVAATMMLCLSVAPDVVRAEGGAAGDDGAGDPYFPKYGNGGYDVADYFVSVRYDPTTGRLNGKTKLTLTATQDLTSFNLDLVLRTSKVAVDGRPASFRAGEHELRITPNQPIDRGETVTVAVTYDGTPQDEVFGGVSPWITTSDGAIALGEPEIAPWWFPSNDHPTDKATYRIHIKVPDGKEAIGAGTFKGRSHADGWTTWRWHVGSQAATYLVFAAIGEYTIEQRTSHGRPYLYAFGTDVGEEAKTAIRYTGTATQYLADQWGAYPFTQIGGVVPNDPDIGFALETQTRPVYDRNFFDFGTLPYVVIHEMAHQWFGDSVSVHRWKNIWLNEGLATYSEWLWSESIGNFTADERFDVVYEDTPPDDPFWDLKIGDPGAGLIFDPAVYDRGAASAHELRNRIGDNAFFDTMRAWVRMRADGTGTTADFKQLAEEVSGEQLDGFFTAWLFTPAKPERTAANGLGR